LGCVCLLGFATGRSSGQAATEAPAPSPSGVAADATVAVERLQRGRALLQDGRYPEALTELLWCFDRCRDRAFWPTRLGEVLDTLGALAKVYPPARAQLVQRRDRRDAGVRAGGTGNDDVAELLALNEVLSAPEASVQTFEWLRKEHGADGLGFFYEGIRRQLWRQRRYQALVSGRPEPDAKLATAAVALREASKRLVGRDLHPDPAFAQNVVADVCLDVEARLALGDRQVDSLVRAVREFAPGFRTDALLVVHAERAHADELSRTLTAQAVRGLDAGEKERFLGLLVAARVELRRSERAGRE